MFDDKNWFSHQYVDEEIQNSKPVFIVRNNIESSDVSLMLLKHRKHSNIRYGMLYFLFVGIVCKSLDTNYTVQFLSYLCTRISNIYPYFYKQVNEVLSYRFYSVLKY